jgi:hypothetical protein
MMTAKNGAFFCPLKHDVRLATSQSIQNIFEIAFEFLHSYNFMRSLTIISILDVTIYQETNTYMAFVLNFECGYFRKDLTTFWRRDRPHCQKLVPRWSHYSLNRWALTKILPQQSTPHARCTLGLTLGYPAVWGNISSVVEF